MDGAAVRLEQGRRESVKVYDRAPWEVAARFAAAGVYAPPRRRSGRGFHARHGRAQGQPRDDRAHRRRRRHRRRGRRRRALARRLRGAVRRGRPAGRAGDGGDQGSGAGRGGVRALAGADRDRGRRARRQGVRRGLDRGDRRRRRRRRRWRSRARARRPCSTPTSRATACAAAQPRRDRAARAPPAAHAGHRVGRRRAARGPGRARAARAPPRWWWARRCTSRRSRSSRRSRAFANRAADMLCKRVIPCLDVDAGRVKKGVRFKELRDAGDPVAVAAAYDAQGADEICFLDITASSDGRSTMLDVVRAHRRTGVPAAHRRRRRALGRGRARAAARGRRQGRHQHRGGRRSGAGAARVRRVRQPGDRRRGRRRANRRAGRTAALAGVHARRAAADRHRRGRLVRADGARGRG